MNISGLKINNYKSFDADGICLNNLDKINVFIGQNNSGKSNILRFWEFLKEIPLNKVDEGGSPVVFDTPSIENFHKHKSNDGIFFTFMLEDADLSQIAQELGYPGKPFITYGIKKHNKEQCVLSITDTFIHQCDEQLVREYVRKHTGTSGGNYQERLKQALNRIKPSHKVSIPTVLYLDEFRKLKDAEEIRKQLHSVIHFTFREAHKKEKKEALISYLEDVLGYEVDISIPDLNQEIEIAIDTFLEPLTSVGTGVHEMILIGMYLTTINSALICIDEPELHLHPRVQRNFLKFIKEKTKHTYFISTHSNHFLDFEVKNKAIYSVKKEAGSTKVAECRTLENQQSLLGDLGIRASEILQTNGIIWVEGPSDRIYIKKWLQFIKPELEEGLHYTFQFYGGKILKHYTLEDKAFQEFINILLVNKNAILVMDSDCSKKHTPSDLNQTKQRVMEECEKSNVICWVTEGREVENYLSNNLLTRLCNEPIKGNKFRKIKTYCPLFKKKTKVEFARNVVTEMEESDMNEKLKTQIKELASRIDEWNT